MTSIVPKLARTLQTICPVLVILVTINIVGAVRPEAEKHLGPPEYLPFIFVMSLFGVLLLLPALLLWIWRPAGWFVSMILNAFFALLAGYAAISDFITRRTPPLGFDLTMLVVVLWFASISTLFASKRSRNFFCIDFDH